MLEKERRQQENDAAEEVCPRIALLPEKIKINTLYFEAKAYQEASSPPAEGCSAGRRTAKHQGVGQVQLGPKASYQRGQVSPLQVGSEDKPGSNLPCGQAHLLAAQLRLSCLLILFYFAPQGGWDAIFSAAPNNSAGFKWILDLVPGCRCGCSATTMSVTFLMKKMNGQ